MAVGTGDNMRLDYHNGCSHGLYVSHTVEVPLDSEGEVNLAIIQEMHDAENGGMSRQAIFLGYEPKLVEIAMDYQPRDWRTGRFTKRVAVFRAR